MLFRPYKALIVTYTKGLRDSLINRWISRISIADVFFICFMQIFSFVMKCTFNSYIFCTFLYIFLVFQKLQNFFLSSKLSCSCCIEGQMNNYNIKLYCMILDAILNCLWFHWYPFHQFSDINYTIAETELFYLIELKFFL